MPRFLAYPLILAVAVGPLLCCCTSGRVFASAAPPGAVGSVSQSSPAPVRSHTSCCAHRHHPAEPKSGGQQQSDHKPVPSKPGEKCPCKDGSEKPELISPEVTSLDLSSFLRTIALDLLASFTLTDAGCLTAEVSHQSVAWLIGGTPSPTDELLFSHHKLRC